MIHYAKGYWGLPLFLKLHGSPFPRTLPFAVVSVAITIWLHLWDSGREEIVRSFAHPYPFQMYGFVIGFLVVLRTNHSLARFMEARTGVETMRARLALSMCEAPSWFSASDARAGAVPHGRVGDRRGRGSREDPGGPHRIYDW